MPFGGTAERGPLSDLIEVICEQGETAQSPALAKQFGFVAQLRIVKEKTLSRTLFVPASQCGGNDHAEKGLYFIAIGYALGDDKFPRVVHWYLTSAKGELVRTFHSVVESRENSNPNWVSLAPTNEMRAEFEAQKRYWLARFGLTAQ
jgi:hypothetical protein